MSLRRPLAAAILAGTLSLATACAGDEVADDQPGSDSSSGAGGEVTIGSQAFDEAALLTAMYAAVLEDEGFTVKRELVETRPLYLNEMPDSIDVAPEYAAGLADELNRLANGEDATPISSNDLQETLDAMAPLLDDKGLSVLEASEANSQNAYFVTQEFSDAEGVTALSDLEGQAVKLAAHPDCKGRDDCEKGLSEVYGIDVTLLPLGYASPETYQSVLDGESQLGQTGTLDGTLEEQGLLLLEDDRGIQPAQNMLPAVSTEFLDQHPEVEEPLNELMGALDNEVLGELLVRVSVERAHVATVAKDFLEEEGLL